MSEQKHLLSPKNISAILLFGPPGSGKETLGKFLATAGTQYHLCPNDVLSSSENIQSSEEHEVHLCHSYVEDLIKQQSFSPEKQDLLLEGIPHTLKQAQLLSKYVTVRHIIVLEVKSPEELLQRKQTKEGLFGWSLDKVHQELESYSETLREVLAFYPSHLVSRINAEQPPLEVLRDVLVRMSHLLSKQPRR